MLSSIFRTARTTARPAVPASRGFARLTLIGRLGADPEVKQSKDGNDYVRYVVATDGPFPPRGPDGSQPQRETLWHTVFSFTPQSYDYLAGLRKGAHVYVETTYQLKAEPNDESGSRRPFLRHEKIKVLDKGPNHPPRGE